jgi:hypothetical protein
MQKRGVFDVAEQSDVDCVRSWDVLEVDALEEHHSSQSVRWTPKVESGSLTTLS